MEHGMGNFFKMMMEQFDTFLSSSEFRSLSSPRAIGRANKQHINLSMFAYIASLPTHEKKKKEKNISRDSKKPSYFSR